MTQASKKPIPMVSVHQTPQYRVLVDEACGIAHESQVLTITLPAQWAEESGNTIWYLQDQVTKRVFPVQPSQAEAGKGFLLLALEPWERLELSPLSRDALPESVLPVVLHPDDDSENAGGWRLSNSRLTVFIAGTEVMPPADPFSCGPVRGMRLLPNGVRRGGSFFDTRRPLRSTETMVIEEGALRASLRYQAYFGNSAAPCYEATFTLDSGSDFIRIREQWDGNAPGDQIVWDFSSNDLPHLILRLDATAGCAAEPLSYFFDHRLCRLFAWTQQSQLADLSDGFALTFNDGGGGDAVGFVTLDGGDWRGSRLNHLEAWGRRWVGDDPASRRNVPDSAKRDAYPSPERIAARGISRTTPRLNIEGWIGETGARSWALVVASATDLQHNRLRRLHTQRGLLSLSALAQNVFRWSDDEAAAGPSSAFVYPDPILEEHLRPRDTDAPDNESFPEREHRRKHQLLDSLARHVYGFWEGAGSAATNPVSGRDIAPRMLQYEYLARTGKLTVEERDRLRAWFAFLICLFASDNYYPGAATMLPMDHPDSVEPTLEGMANQNFYTDVVNIIGMGAQVFRGHPDAPARSRRFREHWARQLEYHVYPRSGVWEESHTYFQHVLFTVLPTLLRRRADGAEDAFAEATFQNLVSGALRQITPRDKRLNDIRYLVPFGDHSAGNQRYYTLYKPLAEAFVAHNPVLARQLSWMYREMGGEEDVAVAPAAPPLVSAYVQGLGYFLRGTDSGGEEFLLALRAGCAWGHHHQDDGSIQFWAKGKALVVDAGYGAASAGGRKFSDTGHSRWTLSDFAAMNYGYRFNRGWIMAHDSAEPFPFAAAHTPTYLQAPAPQTVCPLPAGVYAAHRRAVVRVGPCAFLVIDIAESQQKQTVRFHVPAPFAPPRLLPEGICLDYEDQCRFTLLSVLPGQAAFTPITGAGQGISSTIEIAAILTPDQGRTCAVYLLTAGQDGAEIPFITADSEGATLNGENFTVHLHRNETELTLTDLVSGAKRTLDLSPPARYLH